MLIKSLVFFLAVAFAFEEATGPSDVVVLTDSNFASSINSGSWLVEFYAPWCGHCKHLAPIYEQVATQLKGKIQVGKVDCTANNDVCTAYEIRGYPTIKFVHNGKQYDYQSERTVEEFSKFVLGEFEKSTPSSLPSLDAARVGAVAAEGSDVLILTDANFEKLLSSGGNILLEFYAPWCGHCKKLGPTYEKVATELKGKVKVGKIDCTVETGLAKRFGIKGYPTIKYLHDATIREYKGDRSLEDLVSFVTSGYIEVEASPIPDKPTKFQNFTDDVSNGLQQVERLLKDKLWIVLAAVFVIGLIVGKFLFSSTTKVYVQSQTPQTSIKDEKQE